MDGLYFAPESWDGSDTFRPEDRLYHLVTKRVKVALERANVRNIMFERLSEKERMVET